MSACCCKHVGMLQQNLMPSANYCHRLQHIATHEPRDRECWALSKSYTGVVGIINAFNQLLLYTAAHCYTHASRRRVLGTVQVTYWTCRHMAAKLNAVNKLLLHTAAHCYTCVSRKIMLGSVTVRYRSCRHIAAKLYACNKLLLHSTAHCHTCASRKRMLGSVTVLYQSCRHIAAKTSPWARL